MNLTVFEVEYNVHTAHTLANGIFKWRKTSNFSKSRVKEALNTIIRLKL